MQKIIIKENVIQNSTYDFECLNCMSIHVL